MEDFCKNYACGGKQPDQHHGIRFRFARVLLLTGLLFGFFLQDFGLAQTAPSGEDKVASVQVAGNHRVEKDAILAVISLKEGDVLDQTQLDRDLRDIYRMKFFTNVSIEIKDGPTGKIVIFHVTEKPTIGKIIFEGNEKIKEEELMKETGIKLYSILDDNDVNQSINKLLELYRQKGYQHAEIKTEIESFPNNEVALKYEIAENEKVYIKEIKFEGNTYYDDKELRDVMITKTKWMFSWLTSAGILDKKKVDFDVYNIMSLYHNSGFINAKVADPDITYDKALNGVRITIRVDEGARYRVNNVSVEGDLVIPADELLKKTKITQEEFFNREVAREDVKTIKEACVDKGYAYADVAPRTKEDDEAHLVDIAYHITKGPLVRFERINILGNSVTRNKVIRRELKAVEGDLYSGEAMQKSKENLDRLGFFEESEIETKKGSQEDLMIVDVKVKEKPTGSFSVGAGYSSEDAVFGMFEIAQNNLFGRGQKLSAAAKLSSLTTQFNVGFTEPWLFDTRLSGSINLYKWSQEYDDYDYNGYSYEEYSRDSYGGELGLGFPIDRVDEYTRGSVSYGFDSSDIENIPDDATLAWQDMEGKNVTSSVTLGVRRDSRDKPWDTTKGSVNSLSFEFAGRFLGGDVAFNKILASTAWYFPLVWDTVFLVRGNWGYMEEKTGGKLPVYQKFRLGGLNTVRGFEYQDISPRDPVYYKNTDGTLFLDSLGNPVIAREDPVGGERMMYYNFEYRFPILKKQGFTGLVFFDCGNVFRDNESYTFKDIKKSAGLGIRWYSPMGPLRLEWGKNLHPVGDEASSKWEFSVGGLF